MEDEEIGQGSTDGNVQGQEGTNINPAWNDLLGVIPQELHSQVTPHLQTWDKNYQEGIGKVHSQYESWKPYIDYGIQPDQVNYALQLLDAVENRPDEVLKALQEFYSPGEEQQQEQGLSSEPIDALTNNPEFSRMSEMVNTMAQLLVQQNVAQQNAQVEEQLEQEYAAAREKHGDFDESWVANQLLANPEMSVDEAANAYKEFVQGILAQNNRPGPRVMGAGGSSPNPGVKPSELDAKGRREFIANMLAQAQSQQH